MLNDFSWNMTGYIPKYPVDSFGADIRPYVAERIFQLEPEPPAVDSLNEYILSALQEKNLLYFSFFLHHYEPQLNKRIKSFLGMDGGDLYDTDQFLDIKLSCREQMLQKLTDYDPAKGAEYATYIFPFIRKQRYNTLDSAKQSRVPTGMLRAPIGNPVQKGIFPLQSLIFLAGAYTNSKSNSLKIKKALQSSPYNWAKIAAFYHTQCK